MYLVELLNSLFVFSMHNVIGVLVMFYKGVACYNKVLSIGNEIRNGGGFDSSQ